MPNKGYKHTPETRALISAAMGGNKNCRGYKQTPEAREKNAAAHRGMKHTPDARAKIAAAQRGSRNHNWKGGQTHQEQGYTLVLSLGHPGARRSGYVFEHRLVMEGLLGRYLTTGEQVHHLNGIKDDNRPENLTVVVARGTHFGWVLCPHCQKSFLIR